MQLDILGAQYVVEFDPDLAADSGNLGLTKIAEGRIILDPTMLPDLLPHVLLHEILHVLIYMGHLQFLQHEGTRVDDEGKLDATASLIVEVLRRNQMLNDVQLRIQAEAGSYGSTYEVDTQPVGDGGDAVRPAGG